MKNNEDRLAQLLRELQLEKDKYASLFEGAGDSIFIVDTETSQILEANTNAVRRLGYSRAELLQLTLDDIEVACADSMEHLQWESSFSGTQVYECQYRRKDGSLVQMEVSSRLTRYAEQDVLQNFVRDITERKRVQAELREREAQYRSLTNHLPVGVYRTSAAGEILFANPAVARMLGYVSIEELQTTTAINLYADPIERERQLKEWIAQGGVVQREITLRRKDGTPITVRDIGQVILSDDWEVISIEGILEDITERKQADEAVRQSEERYRTIVEDLADFVVLWTPDGTRTFANKAYCQFQGLPEDEVVGVNFLMRLEEDYRRTMLQKIAQLTPDIPVTPLITHPVVKPDGSQAWVEWMDRAFFDDDGQIIGLQSVGRNITERVKAEQELVAALDTARRLRDEAEAANRAKTTFLANISHDLRTPLNAILGFAQVANRNQALPSDVRENLGEIMRSGETLLVLINQLLDLTRTESELITLDEADFERQRVMRASIAQQINPDQKALSTDEIKVAIPAIPTKLIIRLRESVGLGDMDVIEQTIATIREHDAVLGETLYQLAQRFQFDDLLSLLEGKEES